MYINFKKFYALLGFQCRGILSDVNRIRNSLTKMGIHDVDQSMFYGLLFQLNIKGVVEENVGINDEKNRKGN